MLISYVKLSIITVVINTGAQLHLLKGMQDQNQISDLVSVLFLSKIQILN